MIEPPLRTLRSAVNVMTTVDPADLSEAELPGFILGLRRQMDRLEAVFADAVTTGHRRGVGTVDGYQSTAAWLRWQAGMRAGDVRNAIDAGEAVDLLPETRAAWLDGTITSGAMRVIAAARVEGYDAELQAVEHEFLDAARRKDLWTLQRMTAHFRGCAKRDGRLPSDRSGLRAAIVGDRLVLDGEIHGLAGETIQRALNAFTDPPAPDDDRTPAQRRADALYRICRIAMEAGLDANMASLSAAVVIDWSTLLAHLTRKYRPDSPAPSDESDTPSRSESGAVVDLRGRMDGGFVGPIDPTEIEALLCDCRISRVVTGPDSEPIDVGRSHRIFPASMRRAIVARDQHCRWPGCEKPPGWCEAHHHRPWQLGGDTSIEDGVLLCSRHHHFVHQHPDWHITWDQIHFRVFRPDGRELAPWTDDDSDTACWPAIAS